MKRFLKRCCVVAMAAAVSLGVAGLFTGCGKEDPNTFTIWIGSSVNSSFYNDYGENPVMQYLEKKFDITLEFMTPMVGKELDNFNNLIASGEYPDMMDISFYTDVISNLYDEGYGAALDLTDYISEYMPNYSKFLQENAELTKYAKVDGKYLTLNNYNSAVPRQWGGFMYRRDWLIEYGADQLVTPVANDEYTSGYEYADGVQFPDGYLDEDGYDNPLTIRDWEWMFEIFEKAPDYKYAITLPNIGYHGTGEIISAFGTGVLWNLYEGDTEGVYDTVKFGSTSDGFRSYVETMNKWYKKGWLDNNFTSNSGDMFYALDSDSFTSGKVGMWYGTLGQVGDLLEQSATADVPALEGIDVWGARQPKATADSADPTVFYLDGQETTRRWIVTDAIEGKNYEKFFEMLDWLYSEEGCIVKSYGLSAEQWDEYDIDKSLMTEYDLEDGCYWWVDPDTGEEVPAGTEGAVVYQNPLLVNAVGDLNVAVAGTYMFGLGYDDRGSAYNQQTVRKQHADREWSAYNNYGTAQNSLISQMTSEEGKDYNATQEKIREYLGQILPDMIKTGVTDASWNSFLGALRTRKCDSNTTTLQAVVDRITK